MCKIVLTSYVRLRMANGVSNIIIQNIHVTEINPEFVWGGDGITIDDADMIWIDHVKTSLIGRQHIVLGTESSGKVTIPTARLMARLPGLPSAMPTTTGTLSNSLDLEKLH
jgi:hypothetical protein